MSPLKNKPFTAKKRRARRKLMMGAGKANRFEKYLKSWRPSRLCGERDLFAVQSLIFMDYFLNKHSVQISG